MRKKLNSEAGLTLVELLAATMVLMLLALMLNTGLQMALNTYQTMIAKSEVELLLSTAVDALADDLRYAREVTGEEGSGFQYTTDDSGTGTNTVVNSGFTYTSDSFGAVTGLKVDDGADSPYKGQILANDKPVLSTGAYGSGGISYKAYKVTEMRVTYHKAASTFTIYLKVATADGKISAETPGNGVTVSCLNPPKETTPAGGI